MELRRALRGTAVSAVAPVLCMPLCILLAVSSSFCQGWNEQWPEVLTYKITQDADDGTEACGGWYPAGIQAGLDYLGRDGSGCFTAGLRFAVPDLEQGQAIKYARLRLASNGGTLASGAVLEVRAVAEDSPEPLSAERLPSALPKTEAYADWIVGIPWLCPPGHSGLRYTSPDIAGIINEVLARPDWGGGPSGKVLILTIGGQCCPEAESNVLVFEDYSTDWEERDEPVLEVYPDLADAFVGKPILGRPTDTSVTVNAINLLSIDIYVEYGTARGIYTQSTAPMLGVPAARPAEIVLQGLDSDCDYYYRIRYREACDSVYLSGLDGRFHTQRPSGSRFVFTVQADSHLWPMIQAGDADGIDLYNHTLENISLDRPDFHISLGDFAQVECYADRDAMNLEEALERYLKQRTRLDRFLHSIPFYLVLGNHEGEQGWRVVDPADSLPHWGTSARQLAVPNPVPGDFYSGEETPFGCCGPRGGYYAWEWGDALFVVLDPFWHTTTKPHAKGRGEGSEDPWDWTLGKDQYDWLHAVLTGSCATWKFVFLHHLVGGVRTPVDMFMTPYGHGGIEAARYGIDGRGSYEWGGEDDHGCCVFETMRPGWNHGPIHDVLVAGGVTAVFHGHDHVFVHQVLDGIVYQACPQPSDASYDDGCYDVSGYRLGEKSSNSGHLRVTVEPDYVQVNYVRAVLPADEPLLEEGVPIYNGQACCSYSIGTAGVAEDRGKPAGVPEMSVWPNPFRSETTIRLIIPWEQRASVKIYDAGGRSVATVFDGCLSAGTHRVSWMGDIPGRGRAAPGVYVCELKTEGWVETQKLLLVR